MLQRTPGTFYVSTYLRGPAPLNTALERMRPAVRVLVLLLAAAPMLIGAAVYAIRWLAVDDRTDQGGVYDHAMHTCRFDIQSLPVAPLLSPGIAAACVALTVVGFGAFMLAHRARAL